MNKVESAVARQVSKGGIEPLECRAGTSAAGRDQAEADNAAAVAATAAAAVTAGGGAHHDMTLLTSSELLGVSR